MESLIILNYSKSDLTEISRQVRENESFVALLEGGDMYNPIDYLIPHSLSNYGAMLDRNVYTRITALVRGDKIPPHALDDHRWAAAVLAFCQIAEIKFQYGSSLQEYASTKGGEAAISEFECFYRADNCNPQAFIDFAVGRSKVLDLSSNSDLAPIAAPPSKEEFEADIYQFRLNYVLALKLVLLSLQTTRPEKLMIEFIDWMDHDFLLSAPALHFANLLFSPSRMKGMIKAKTLRGIRNIAWDLALVQMWRRQALKGIDQSQPVLLITRDKVVKFLANRLVASDEEEFKGLLVDPWLSQKAKGEAVFRRYLELDAKLKAFPNGRPRKSDTEIDALTRELESQVAAIQS